MKTPSRLRRPLVLAGFVAALSLGGCSSGAAPATSPASSESPSASGPVSTPGGGGGSSGDTGSGIGASVEPGPVDPIPGQPKLVIPLPGRLNPHPVGASSFEPAVNGHHVLVKVTWYSGVEPCSVLDSVAVERVANAIAITLIEGSSDASAICIEIAQHKATIVDLGELESGDYKIFSPAGDARPVMITIS
jgi:hypothetical protein